jgi:hypothetical protein
MALPVFEFAILVARFGKFEFLADRIKERSLIIFLKSNQILLRFLQ